MTSRPGRTSKRTNKLKGEMILGRTRSDDKQLCVSLRQQNVIAGKDIFN